MQQLPRTRFVRTAKRLMGGVRHSMFFQNNCPSSSDAELKVQPLLPQNHWDERVHIEEKGFPELFFHSRHERLFGRVPTHKIPKLNILDSMVSKIKPRLGSDLSDTVIVGVQHILETTASLLQALIKTGIPAENIWLMGKIYSTSLPVAKSILSLGVHLMYDAIPTKPDGYQKANREAISKMWTQLKKFIREHGNIKRIIVLDDGGRLIELSPDEFRINFQMAAVEQTRGGLYSKEVNSLLCPIIPVASAAIKNKYLEPLLIAKALFRAERTMTSLSFSKDKTCGIIGNGAIGRAIADYLLSNGYAVIGFDKNVNAFSGLLQKKLVRASCIEQVIANSSIIFGCTGRDITSEVDVFELASRDKVFISTTSEQNEFLTLLNVMTNIFYRDRLDEVNFNFNPVGDIVCRNSNERTITVKNMGYPFNFPVLDPTGNWINPWVIPAQDIELTQCAMYGGLIQGIISAAKPVTDGYTVNESRVVLLDPYIQKYIAQEWWKREGNRFAGEYSERNLEIFSSIESIIENSGRGIVRTNDMFKECFANESLEGKMPGLAT